jgi:hypothetical protein
MQPIVLSSSEPGLPRSLPFVGSVATAGAKGAPKNSSAAGVTRWLTKDFRRGFQVIVYASENRDHVKPDEQR